MQEREQRLLEIMSIQSTSGDQTVMQIHLFEVLSKLADHVEMDAVGNIYATKGVATTFPCVVAHMDTVHDLIDDFRVLQGDEFWAAFDFRRMRQVGIGGDDKVGIFIALEALREAQFIKIAFFVDEEVGCDGSKAADMKFFDDVGFVLQCDRRGYGDFITNASGTELCGKNFTNAIKEQMRYYGMKKQDGMMTDVMQLKRNGLKVACANMSCGYYRPHMDDETICIHEVFDTMFFVLDIIKNVGHMSFPHTYAPPKYVPHVKYDRHSDVRRSKPALFEDDDYERLVWEDEKRNPEKRCYACGVTHNINDLVHSDDVGELICTSCFSYIEELSREEEFNRRKMAS